MREMIPPFERWLALVAAPGAAADWGALAEAFGALRALDGTPQDPRHHAEGDVGLHTRMVLEALLGDPAYAAMAPARRALAFFAALFHDVGKPATTVEEPDGSVSSRGHSRLGAKMAAEWAWRAGAPIGWREELRRLVIAHQEPFFAFKDGAEERMRRLSHEVDLGQLAALARADALGRQTNPPEGRLRAAEAVEWFELCAREDGCWGRPWATAGARETREWIRKGLLAVDPRWTLPGDAGFPVVLLSGMPASGKDRFCQERFAGWPVVSFDAGCERAGAAVGTKAAARAAGQTVEAARELLRKRRAFVWNATHLSRQSRQACASLCEAYGARLHWICVEAPLEELLRRNAARDSSLPQAKLAAMARLWEAPEAAEGDFVAFFGASGEQEPPVRRSWELGDDGQPRGAVERAWAFAHAAGALPEGVMAPTRRAAPKP
jgi:putative nucleotidyltransferase with HDIG domain